MEQTPARCAELDAMLSQASAAEKRSALGRKTAVHSLATIATICSSKLLKSVATCSRLKAHTTGTTGVVSTLEGLIRFLGLG